MSALDLEVTPSTEVEVTRPPGQALPLVVRSSCGDGLREWGRSRAHEIRGSLRRVGAVLFRGFRVDGLEDFQSFVASVGGPLIDYEEPTSPRTRVGGSVYTSTDHPAHQRIFLHNERSYSSTWPETVAFYCEVPAEVGGATPVADCRAVLRRIPSDVRRRFEELGWMYVRNFHDGLGIPWQEVFGTDDRAAAEAVCRRFGSQCEWLPDGHLRTTSRRLAIRVHPQTDEAVWFNHVAFFHVSTLEPATAQALRALFEEEDLPNNTYYGDGSPIEPDTVEAIRQAYESESVAIPWTAGDVLLVDNMLAAHGRASFRGSRRVLVAMAGAIGDVSPW